MQESLDLNPEIIWPIEKFKNDFEVIELIGQGQYGEVFSANYKRNDNATVAVKFLKCKKASEKLRIRDEIDILKELKHDNVIQLFGAYEDHCQFVQVLEHLSGGELFQRVIECAESLSEFDIAHQFMRQICQACSYLTSKDVVHLDIKPENVMCNHLKKDCLVKLVDFGFARKLSENDIRVLQGTPEFVSPEVIKYEPVTLKTDMWSIGVLTYVLLSGLSPFLGENNQETYDNIVSCDYTTDEPEFEDISEEAKDFIVKLLKVKHDDRMSADEALEHPWLKSAMIQKKPPRRVSMLETSPRLNNVMSRLKWQKCTNVLLACSKFKQALSQ